MKTVIKNNIVLALFFIAIASMIATAFSDFEGGNVVAMIAGALANSLKESD